VPTIKQMQHGGLLSFNQIGHGCLMYTIAIHFKTKCVQIFK
jgi:hypothetical protein